MSKKATIVLTLISILSIPVLSFGQIPNAGFESWGSDTLSGWWINNIAPLYTTVTASTSSHTGTYALYGVVVSSLVGPAGPSIQSGPGGEGVPYSQRPTAFTGWYRFAPQSGDRFGVNVVLFKGGIENGIGVGVAAIANPTAVSSWTQFTAPFVYQTNDIPDVCAVQIMIVGPGTGANAIPHVGSSYFLDDLAVVGGTSSVLPGTESVPSTFDLHQNYPNPFNPTTTIGYDLPTSSMVRLRVFDILGREVSTLVNSVQGAGKHQVRFDGMNYPSGFYFYKLETPAFTSTKRMMLVK